VCDRLPVARAGPPATHAVVVPVRVELLNQRAVFTKRDRTARLLGVANLLHQHPQGLTAQQIADRTGMNVRTVYRDLQALEREVGVKYWQEGTRYGAERSSFLPPLSLTLHEALTLFLSTRLMQRFQDYRDPHVIGAFTKLTGILPPPFAQHVHATLAWLHQQPRNDTRTRIFDLIATAWAEGRQVKIRYPTSTPDGRSTSTAERVISPYFVEPNPGGHSRYVIAHDSVSGEARTFKVERIEQAELTADQFDIPLEFDVGDRLRHAWGISDEDAVHVRLRFIDASAARRALESTWHPSQRIEHQPDGSLEMTLDVGGLLEITPWLLGWGAAVEIIEPQALRDSIASIARDMVERYSDQRV
jgi:predicted DNA-binding transcriptional regulator YafY